MKTLYLECHMGAAGDMLMGALMELLPEPEAFVEEMNALGIPKVHVERESKKMSGILGAKVHVYVDGEEEKSVDAYADAAGDGHSHGRDHHHHVHHGHHHHGHDAGDNAGTDAGPHPHGTMAEIESIIARLPLSGRVKGDILAVYGLIAAAEGAVHGQDVDCIHFHELGMMDAVADIAGVCRLMELLSPERIMASPVHVGSGHVHCAHGTVPVPAPATALILQGVPTYGGQIRGELCTPTGAALLKHFVQEFGPQPLMRTDSVGYGLGSKEFPMMNCVRAFLGEGNEEQFEISELNCNLDDMPGEDLAFALGALLGEGALDAFVVPIQMKKNRPGQMLVCLCEMSDEEKMAKILLRHTSTFGVRRKKCARYVLQRKEITVNSPYGELRGKAGWGYGVQKTKLEYDDLARLAREHNVTIAEIRNSAEPVDGTEEGFS